MSSSTTTIVATLTSTTLYRSIGRANRMNAVPRSISRATAPEEAAITNPTTTTRNIGCRKPVAAWYAVGDPPPALSRSRAMSGRSS